LGNGAFDQGAGKHQFRVSRENQNTLQKLAQQAMNQSAI